MYDLDIKPEADKIFKKLSKKGSEQLKVINKKLFKIRLNPYHKERVVDVYYYDHHDKIYKWRPTK